MKTIEELLAAAEALEPGMKIQVHHCIGRANLTWTWIIWWADDHGSNGCCGGNTTELALAEFDKRRGGFAKEKDARIADLEEQLAELKGTRQI